MPHFEDKAAALTTRVRALKPGGRLVVVHFTTAPVIVLVVEDALDRGSDVCMGEASPRGAGLDDEMLAGLDGDLVEGRGDASLLPGASSKQCDNDLHREHRGFREGEWGIWVKFGWWGPILGSDGRSDGGDFEGKWGSAMAGVYRMVPFELVEGADDLREGKEQLSSELPDVTLSTTRPGYLLVWIEADLERVKADGVSWH